jgi:hypothetical protein
MTLKATWLATVGLTTLVLVTVGSLSKASQQMWNPEVAHAARVTANLLKDTSLRPTFFHRGKSLRSRPMTYQIKKLEFQLAQEQYKTGKTTQLQLNQKATRYHQAAEALKLVPNSDKITD